MALTFIPAKSEQEIKGIHDYNVGAFSDPPGFKWTVDGIKNELKDGWQLCAVKDDDEIIAAVFYKKDDGTLLTKNTAVKMTSKGSGFSHQIKEFFEEKAKELKVNKIIHYCEVDNFRMISLNERHGYHKVSNGDGQEVLVEWVKDLK